MLLSIVVPTYNVEDYLANCLESLLDQDLDPNTYEIIVINDGSTDGSRKIAVDYACREPRIRVIDQENRGLSGARNTGIENASGTFIYFIDSDDYIARDTLGGIVGLMEENQLDVLGLGVTETDRLDLRESGNRHQLQKEITITDGITFVARHNYMNNVWWYMIRRDFLQELGLIFPVGRFVEDANFTARLLVSAQRVAYVGTDFYRYVIRPASIMRRKDKAHIAKLIRDYKANVIDFAMLLDELERKDHPEIKGCLRRIKSRMESFVFFSIVKTIRTGCEEGLLHNIVSDYRKLNVYPIRNFLGEDYKKLTYRVLVPLINSPAMLQAVNRLYPS